MIHTPTFLDLGIDRGPWGNRLIDAPLITSLLQSTIGSDYHFCHSDMSIAPRGAKGVKFHQDYHHWKHKNPINLAERNKWYIQIFYYPNGFKQRDGNLMIVPGRHRVSPTRGNTVFNKGFTPEKLLMGEFDDEAGRKLEVKRLEVPSGSLVYLNTRMYHGVEAFRFATSISLVLSRYFQGSGSSASSHTGDSTGVDGTG